MKKNYFLLTFGLFSQMFFSQAAKVQISDNKPVNHITPGAWVSCNSGNTTSYAKAYKLSDYGINYDFKITKLTFGVSDATTVSATYNVIANIYNLVGTMPSGALALLSTTNVPIAPANIGGLVDTGTSYSQIVANGTSFVFEVSHQDVEAANVFKIGNNTEQGSQTTPSYIKGTCVDAFYHDVKDFNYPTSAWVMTIEGENAILGTKEVINSTDVQIFPVPAKDQLNFKLKTLAKIENISILDMNGRQVINQKGALTVDVSSLAKGVYIVKLSTNNNITYIQKFVKE